MVFPTGSSSTAAPRDARVALLVTVAWVVASLTFLRTGPAMLGALGFVAAWHLAVTGDARASARALARVGPFALVIVLLNAVFVPGTPLVSLGGVRLASREGFGDGVFFSLRLAVMLMAVSLLVAAVTPEALARGVHDLLRRVSRRAASRVAFFVFMAMGFLPLVRDELDRIRVAQSFRGAGLSGGLRGRADSARAWLIPLLVSAVHRSGQLAMAVELRDVRHRLVVSIEPPRLRAADVMLLVTSAVSMVALWRFSNG